MADYIKMIQTQDGPKQIDYTALANLPIIDTELSESSENLIQNKAIAVKFTSLEAEILGKTNTEDYTPTSDYHPSTKKYVDDAKAAIDKTLEDKLEAEDVLILTNETEYTPTSDYHPSTKKYVDDIKTKTLEEVKSLVFDSITLKDSVTGYEYIVEVQNGTLITYCKPVGLAVTTMPTKVEYSEGETFDPTGMVVSLLAADGSTTPLSSDQYIYDEVITAGATSVVVTYSEGSSTFTVNVPITVKSIEAQLVDFEYTYDESTGMYTITDWKGTYQGVESTECVVPDSSKIIL